MRGAEKVAEKERAREQKIAAQTMVMIIKENARMMIFCKDSLHLTSRCINPIIIMYRDHVCFNALKGPLIFILLQHISCVHT